MYTCVVALPEALLEGARHSDRDVQWSTSFLGDLIAQLAYFALQVGEDIPQIANKMAIFQQQIILFQG